MSRVISALSLDGYRIASEITLTFRRPLAAETANSLADEAATAAAYVLGNQICQGELPLSKAELVDQIGERTSATLGKYAELQVSALAFTATRAPNRSMARSRADALGPAKLDAPPPPAARTSISGTQPAATPAGAGGRVSQRPPLSGQPQGHSGMPAPADVSNFEYLQPRMLWRQVLAKRAGEHGPEELGLLLAPALRDSAATALFLALLAVDPARVERLPITGAAQLQQLLLREIGACFGAAVYRVLAAQAVDKGHATLIAENAVRNALGSEQPNAQEMGLYFISQSPVSELANRMAQLLNSPADARRILQALAGYCQTLRTELGEVAIHIRRLGV